MKNLKNLLIKNLPIKSAVAFFFLFFLHGTSIGNGQQGISYNWKLNYYYKEGNNDGEKEYKINYAYRERNYALFSILANVRNGSGNTPIAEPKGLPEDISEVVKNESASWDGDGHSHSFFTMKEIYDYYKDNNVVRFSGLVDADGVKSIESGGMPSWWCQAGSNNELVYKEWEQENFVLKGFIEDLERHFDSSYHRKDFNSEKFRIVFWFDN